MLNSQQKNQDNMQVEHSSIAVIGGGVAGTSVALYLSELGLDVTLLEKGPSLVNGPPMCHLHAGGNLYREISDEHCLTLLSQSIDLLRMYPNAIDYRPTVIAVPTHDKYSPLSLVPRLQKLQTEYQRLIERDPKNKVLGESCDYFRLFERSEIENLARFDTVKSPQTLEQWMIPIAKYVDLDKLKFPLVIVQEYGLNLFRVAASASLTLEQIAECNVLTNSQVKDIKQQDKHPHWLVKYQHQGEEKSLTCNYLINAAGFRCGEFDDMLNFKRQRLVEFKAAYVSHWDENSCTWPEIIFHGERGTPQGMGQFTPYPDGYFQLHGMTENITLFKDGLVESSVHSAQPQLNAHFLQKIDAGWNKEEVIQRTQAAIKHLTPYIPNFASAKATTKPLFGAQQIPGDDPVLRTADISFVGEHYARCEIVKASSVLTVADMVTKQLIKLGYIKSSAYGSRQFKMHHLTKPSDIQIKAQQLAEQRGYPTSLATLTTSTRE